MLRRRVLQGLGLSALLPLNAWAQRHIVVGYVSSTSRDEFREAAVRRGLGELGFLEKDGLVFEYRWADIHYERLPSIITELTKIPCAVLVVGGNQAAVAVKKLAPSVPTVFVIGDDPVQLGVVASLNRPGGDITGVTFYSFALAGKRLELLHELVPPNSVLAMLWHPATPSFEAQRREVEAAAARLGHRVEFIKTASPQELETALAAIVNRRMGGLFYGTDPFFNGERQRLATFAVSTRLPFVFSGREYINAGGLIAYGADVTDSYIQAGRYAGRILNGERPADLPVMQPTKFELVLNLKGARALGVEFPQKILALADDVIE